MEEWREVPSYPNYEVSNYGNIKKEGKLLKPTVNNNYRKIQLQLNGAIKTIKLCHLVAEAFIGERPPGYDVHHINCNKLDDYYQNLLYISKSEHMKYHRKIDKALMPKETRIANLWKGREQYKQQGVHNSNARLTEQDICQIKTLHLKGVSAKIISQLYKLNRNYVYRILNGKCWQHIANL